MLPEEGQQGERFLSDALDRVFDQLRSDDPQAVLYTVVMSGNLTGQVVYGTVHGDGIPAAPVRPASFRIPNGGIDGHLRSDLFPFRIYAHLAQ